MNDPVTWLAPRAMPSATGPMGATPSVLAFATDDFMVELETTLAQGDWLERFRARPVTWRDDEPEGFPAPTELPDPGPTKLYQAAHGCHYLVAAHLVCRRYGLPDRRMSRAERADFVIRRRSGADEFAWVVSDGRGRWQRLDDPGLRHPAEELLPLAPTAYDTRGRRTRLLAGVVPVGAREKYEARSVTADDDPTDGPSATELALRDVVGSTLFSLAQLDGEGNLPLPAPPAKPNEFEDREIEALEFALLDLADWLDATTVALPATAAAKPISASAEASSWGAAMVAIRAARTDMLTGSSGPLVTTRPDRQSLIGFVGSGGSNLIDQLVDEIPEGTELGGVELEGDDDGTIDDGSTGRYVFRTVYQRSDCADERRSWVSPPTEPFRFANFFDPDAPARPVQISLPFDTSPKGLRQFPRNVKVLLSDQLRGQMTKINEDFEETGGRSFDVGMLCSLSIPIITICALILLMILVSILNIVFFWMPFFKVCVPKVSVES